MTEKKKVDIHDLKVGKSVDIDSVKGIDNCGALLFRIKKQKNGKYTIEGAVEAYFYSKKGDKCITSEPFTVKDCDLVDW